MPCIEDAEAIRNILATDRVWGGLRAGGLDPPIPVSVNGVGLDAESCFCIARFNRRFCSRSDLLKIFGRRFARLQWSRSFISHSGRTFHRYLKNWDTTFAAPAGCLVWSSIRIASNPANCSSVRLGPRDHPALLKLYADGERFQEAQFSSVSQILSVASTTEFSRERISWQRRALTSWACRRVLAVAATPTPGAIGEDGVAARRSGPP